MDQNIRQIEREHDQQRHSVLKILSETGYKNCMLPEALKQDAVINGILGCDEEFQKELFKKLLSNKNNQADRNFEMLLLRPNESVGSVGEDSTLETVQKVVDGLTRHWGKIYPEVKSFEVVSSVETPETSKISSSEVLANNSTQRVATRRSSTSSESVEESNVKTSPNNSNSNEKRKSNEPVSTLELKISKMKKRLKNEVFDVVSSFEILVNEEIGIKDELERVQNILTNLTGYHVEKMNRELGESVDKILKKNNKYLKWIYRRILFYKDIVKNQEAYYKEEDFKTTRELLISYMQTGCLLFFGNKDHVNHLGGSGPIIKV